MVVRLNDEQQFKLSVRIDLASEQGQEQPIIGSSIRMPPNTKLFLICFGQQQQDGGAVIAYSSNLCFPFPSKAWTAPADGQKPVIPKRLGS
jgi:hypothetical protein